MTYDTPTNPIDEELLVSRFDNAHLVRVDPGTRTIAVWNGSQTINLYDFRFNEIQDSPHSVPKDDDGNPASRSEVNKFIEELFDEYETGL